MDTNRNRPAVLAQLLRGSVERLKGVERRVDPDAAFVRAQELAMIAGVADELDAHVLRVSPDPVLSAPSIIRPLGAC